MDIATEISTLIRLITTGSIVKGVRNDALVSRFRTAQWVLPSRRKNEWLLRESARAELAARLQNICPTWEQDMQFLQGLGLNILNPSDVSAIPVLRRSRNIAVEMLNHRNWNAATSLSPKRQPKLVPTCVLTTDWVLRVRPNKGLTAIRPEERTEDLWEARKGGEYTVGERGWLDVVRLTGTLPAAIITCENIGPYIDLPVNDSVAVLYSPGSDIQVALSFLRVLPHQVPWIHFGDLDSRGLQIPVGIATALARPLRIFIPSFAGEYLDQSMPDVAALQSNGDETLDALQAEKRRLWQEAFMTDPRLPGELSDFILKVQSEAGPDAGA